MTNLKRILIGATASAILLSSVASPALAANENASCFGLAFSEHGPAHEAKGEIFGAKELAESLGIPLGQLAAFFAQLHLGTHTACGAAVGE